MASDTTTQHNSNTNENQHGPLPGGWEERRTPKGRLYYVNHNTRSTTWTRPSSESNKDGETNTAGSGSLPAGWEERRTPNGRLYYVNHSTRSTTWDRPSSESNKDADHQAQEGGTGSGSLPPGWVERRTKDGRLYYVDHNTRSTTWTRPSSESNHDADHQAHGGETNTAGLGSLPSGWEERRTPDGELYYVDHNTRSTTWLDPRPANTRTKEREDTEYLRLLEEDLRKAEAARRRAEKEEFERLLEEDMRKAQEAHRRAVEQEEKRRQAERESKESERREREDREKKRREREDREKKQREQEDCEKERREREDREKERREGREKERRRKEREAAKLVTRIRDYEDKWARLRSNAIEVEHLSFCDIPWPSFEDVRDAGDVTEERVLAFVRHPRPQASEQIQPESPGGGLVKSLRLEMLRWHPDKFEGKVLGKVLEGDREAVREVAGNVARILTTFSARMR